MPLRPELYDRLCRRFARQGGVKIANEDCPMYASYERDALTGRVRLEVHEWGESYVICCPFCTDTRHRLWINHRWGYHDPTTHTLNLGFLNCFNEGCFQGRYDRQRSLYNLVFNDVLSGPRMRDVILQVAAPPPPRVYEPPGQVVPIHELPADHPAVVYLTGRGFDPQELGHVLGVGYCVEAAPQFRKAGGRIIIPVWCGGKLVGWQARWVGEPPDKYTSKFWTMPGTKKRQILYNYDVARRSPHVVVTEGCTDVWRVGPAGVALFGKTLSADQKLLVAAAWREGAAVVLLDGDAPAEARKVYDALAGVVRQRVLVQLPADVDPGDLQQGEIWRLIQQAAREQSVQLPLGQAVVRLAPAVSIT